MQLLKTICSGVVQQVPAGSQGLKTIVTSRFTTISFHSSFNRTNTKKKQQEKKQFDPAFI